MLDEDDEDAFEKMLEEQGEDSDVDYDDVTFPVNVPPRRSQRKVCIIKYNYSRMWAHLKAPF